MGFYDLCPPWTGYVILVFCFFLEPARALLVVANFQTVRGWLGFAPPSIGLSGSAHRIASAYHLLALLRRCGVLFYMFWELHLRLLAT